MKTDRYTKIIMTAITFYLAKIAFQDIQAIKPLFANNDGYEVHKIAICDKGRVQLCRNR